MRRLPLTARGGVDKGLRHGEAADMVTMVRTPEQARDLAALVLDRARDKPVVCISISASRDEPWVDARQITDDLEGLAHVAVISAGDAAWAFHDQLPPRTDVYGGATRIYPPDPSWQQAPWLARLHYAYDDGDRARVTAAITRDALGAVRAASKGPGPVAAAAPAGGHVLGIAGGRALVNLTEGASGQATIWPELIADVDGDQVLAKGMPVWGFLDPVSRRIDVAAMRREPHAALAGYRAGDSVLARVAAVTRTTADLELWPGTTAAVDADAFLADQSVRPDEALSVGETVAVRILHTEPHIAVTFVDADEPLPAPSILEGGPPWLIPPQSGDPDNPEGPDLEPSIPSRPETTPTPTPPAADPAVVALQQERDALALRIAEVTADLERAHATTRRLRTELRQAREREGKARRVADQGTDALRVLEADRSLFADPEQQLRFEVDLAWARRTDPGEKAATPLTSWSIGPEFLDTLDRTEGVDRAKVVDVIVDVLTGRAALMAGRQMHQLRTGAGGNAPPRVRADGAIYWRVSIQVGTPSARRLHFAQSRDGRHLELTSVRLHDDFRP